MTPLRIDAHQHFWRYRPEDFPWIGEDMGVLRRDYLPVDLSEHLSRWRIDGTVAVQARPLESETDWLLSLAAEHESRIRGVVGWVDPRSRELERSLGRWSGEDGLLGFREMVQDAPDPSALLRDEPFNRGIATLQRRGYVYEVLIHDRELPEAIRFCARHDAGALVLDHLGKPAIADGGHETWAKHIRALARQPHVYAKVSGLVTEADWSRWTQAELMPYVETALEAFGPERLMFGSDWPVCQVAASYDRVAGMIGQAASGLDDRGRAALWGGTAARCYGLDRRLEDG
ncbi:MAG TPA: amidohydrolase family protein [Gammaproteobacteria bacterium]|nr:amidohydrolase family protein [Gammaproteobacteria bacterium]